MCCGSTKPEPASRQISNSHSGLVLFRYGGRRGAPWLVPPSHRMCVQRVGHSGRQPRRLPPTAPTAPTALTAADIAEVVRDSVQTVVRTEVQRALATHVGQSVDPDVLATVVREALERALAHPSTPQGVAPRVTSSTDPVFIPSTILSSDLKPEITTATQSTAGDAVDEGAAALKAARKGRTAKKDS